MNKFKAIIFDIDGTLTNEISWTAFTRDIGGSVAEHLAIYGEHVNGNIGYDESKEKLLKLWQETGKAKKAHIEPLFHTWPIKKEAQSTIDWLKDNEYLVCLITGSVGIYARYVAERLGVSDYYANAELHFDNEGDLVDFDYTTDQAAVKLKQLNDYCSRYDLKLEECVPVGDSSNDIQLFQQTGNGVLVLDKNTAVELKEAAWKTIDSLEELRSLL